MKMRIYVEFEGFKQVDKDLIVTTGECQSYVKCHCGYYHDSHVCPKCGSR